MKVAKKFFCTAVSKPQVVSNLVPAKGIKLADIDIAHLNNIGSIIPPVPKEVTKIFSETGFLSDNVNVSNFSSSKGLFLTYLKNMNLLFDYDNLFRDFIQSIARDDFNYLNLVTEPYLANHINSQVQKLRRKGYFVELEALRNKMSYEVVDWALYKNLRINRYKNNIVSESDFENYGKKFKVFKPKEDISVFDNNRPFILSSTLKVTTPMKLVLLNQDMSVKLHGKEENTPIDYLVKFETELKYLDLTWILPTVNKPSRMRQSRISDFNNILNGNSFMKSKEELA